MSNKKNIFDHFDDSQNQKKAIGHRTGLDLFPITA